ncbi:hypothetical protein PGTUg99_016346 [Puccinia graminis f. sp. tritici]|uniref:Uncharacterized protein n=1 Tax=Puccinia graminis f. sp. tritici TaxID=56615 RepID=A0A5B0N201_PUCGR|nr:hypothetical protein PGTUg99_016346 [Puccinia graminis f. sp. tritici]
MNQLFHIRGSRHVDSPIAVNPDGSIEICFTDSTVTCASQVNLHLLPKYSITAKPMDLDSRSGGSWLTYYKMFHPSESNDFLKVSAHASYWQNEFPNFMQNQGAPQISGDVRFSLIQPCVIALKLCTSSAMYGKDIGIGHTAWINGCIMRKQNFKLSIKDQSLKSFNVKYVIPSNPKLINTHAMIRVGQEFFFDGFLAGWDLKQHMAIIRVLAVSTVTTGSGTKSTNSAPQATPLNKGRKFITFEEGDSNNIVQAPFNFEQKN